MGQTLPERGIIFFWFSGDGRCLEILQITSTLRLRRSRTGARKTQFHGLKLTLGRVLQCINVLAAKFWNWNMFVNPRTFFLLDEGASYILHCNRRKVWFWWLWSKYCTTHYALFLSFIRRKKRKTALSMTSPRSSQPSDSNHNNLLYLANQTFRGGGRPMKNQSGATTTGSSWSKSRWGWYQIAIENFFFAKTARGQQEECSRSWNGTQRHLPMYYISASSSGQHSFTWICCPNQSPQLIDAIFCCQAVSIMSVLHPNWEVLDVSQNVERMPCVECFRGNFVCVTLGTWYFKWKYPMVYIAAIVIK